jgi:hypothetical protein
VHKRLKGEEVPSFCGRDKLLISNVCPGLVQISPIRRSTVLRPSLDHKTSSVGL